MNARTQDTIVDMARVQPVVDAVLYEGYILYPYRPSSTKNRQRWTFGGIYPRPYFEATGGADPCHMQTQCLVEGGVDARLEVRVRFLHPLAREVGELDPPLREWPQDGEPAVRPVAALQVGDRQLIGWQEAVEREVLAVDGLLGELAGHGSSQPFAFAGQCELEPARDDDGWFRGVLMRRQQALRGRVDVQAEAVADNVWRLTVRIENLTPMEPSSMGDREQASLYAFASTHTILGVRGGAFVSQIDPPPALAAAAATCENQGSYPVLIGTPGRRDAMLSSPIILYDYPEVAPESPGDLYDALEIDEILSLRILAMTDAEKREMAATDPRAAALLARTESLDGDDFMRLHGVMRDPAPAATTREPACGRDDDAGLHVGDHVRLRPKAGGDVMDVVLAGMSAVIESIEHDVEGRVHVAVAVDDDPGREWGLQRMPGHRFFFAPDEIELLQLAPRPEASA